MLRRKRRALCWQDRRRSSTATESPPSPNAPLSRRGNRTRPARHAPQTSWTAPVPTHARATLRSQTIVQATRTCSSDQIAHLETRYTPEANQTRATRRRATLACRAVPSPSLWFRRCVPWGVLCGLNPVQGRRELLPSAAVPGRSSEPATPALLGRGSGLRR